VPDPLLSRRHWIFDLDGTLTVAAHDFDAMRRALDLPMGVGLLEALDALPPHEAAPRHAKLRAWEEQVASQTLPEPDARPLLEALAARGARLGIVTRNESDIAWATLDRAGFSEFFAPEHVLGRDRAAAKPDPDGIRRLLRAWGAPPDDAVMVGDYRYDLVAGRNAGVATVLVDRRGRGADWSEWADRTVARLDDLLSR
jgi:HAD superfamily hydrolase (TIGR01509 family)